MRYYRIEITDSSGQPVNRSAAQTGFQSTAGAPFTYTSHPNGVNSPPDPGALRVELDVWSGPAATTNTNSVVRIHGISLQDISQSTDLNGKAMSIYGGMGKGLPLANPRQSGLLAQATIFQCVGNWTGVEQTLDFVLAPASAPPGAPDKNLTMNWKANTPLASAIKDTLSTAYPGTKATITISDKLVLAHDEPSFFGSIGQFAQYVEGVSKDVMGSDQNYRGVQVLYTPGGEFRVFDETTQNAPKQIEFTDFVGQPTWVGPGTVQATLVMRADILSGDFVKLPPTQLNATQNSFSQFSNLRQGLIFQGNFSVSNVRHVGDSRSPEGSAWVTVLDLNPSTQTAGT